MSNKGIPRKRPSFLSFVSRRESLTVDDMNMQSSSDDTFVVDTPPECSKEPLSSSSADNDARLKEEEEMETEEQEAMIMSMEPGDHVIRWAFLGMIYPIQIHGIVLSVCREDEEEETPTNCSSSSGSVDRDNNTSDSDDENENHDDSGGDKGNDQVSDKGSIGGRYRVTIVDFGLTREPQDISDATNTNINEGGTAAPATREEDSITGEENHEGGIERQQGEENEDFNILGFTTATAGRNNEMPNNARHCRLNIVTLTDAAEICKWKKVHYGETAMEENAGKFQKIKSWFQRQLGKDSKEKEESDTVKDNASTCNIKEMDIQKEPVESAGLEINTSSTQSSKAFDEKTTNTNEEEKDADLQKEQETNSINNWFSSFWTPKRKDSINNESSVTMPQSNSYAQDCGDDNTDSTSDTPSQQEQPELLKLPKSDPATIVLARVRFLLEHNDKVPEEQVLPPYHLLFSNSECIAVWCKTGTFSTLQAVIFLYSTTVGQAKAASTVAILAATATQTVTTTSVAPAAGLWGSLFGLTTTTTTTAQVGLLVAQPWLIPVIAAYGVTAIGTPYLVLRRAKQKWSEATSTLTDKFWAWASPDVFVAAIRHWSVGLEDV